MTTNIELRDEPPRWPRDAAARSLVNAWRCSARDLSLSLSDREGNAMATVYEECADQLEAILQGSENPTKPLAPS